MARKTTTQISQEQDINSAELNSVIEILSNVYSSPNTLNQRVLLPKPSNLAEHRIQSNDVGAAIQWVGGNKGDIIPRYVLNTDNGLEMGPALVTKGKSKLAARERGDAQRKRFALDLQKLGVDFFPEMSNREIENRAGTKYEYINARGNEAHHILPIGYMGKVLSKLRELGIHGPVVDELVRRKMSVGDTAPNLASLQTKAAPGREFMVEQDKTNVIDNHDKVHAMSEDLLEMLNLPQQNKGEYRVNDFMDDPNVSAYQKQAYSMAIPQAHRLAVQAVQLDPSKVRNQRRLMDSIVRLAADNQQSKMNLSPLSQSLLSQVHGQVF